MTTLKSCNHSINTEQVNVHTDARSYKISIRAVSHRNINNTKIMEFDVEEKIHFNSEDFLKKMTYELNNCNIGHIANSQANPNKKNPLIFIPANTLDTSLQIKLFNEFINQLGEYQETTNLSTIYFGISLKKLRGFPQTKPSIIVTIEKKNN